MDNTNPQATFPAQDICQPVPVVVDRQEEVVAASGYEPMNDVDRAMLAELVDAVRCQPAASAVTTSES